MSTCCDGVSDLRQTVSISTFLCRITLEMANFRSFLANDLLIPGFICNFADNMKPTIIEDEIFEFEPFEKDGSELMAAETSWRGMAEELCVYFEKDMKNKSHPKVTFKWAVSIKPYPHAGMLPG